MPQRILVASTHNPDIDRVLEGVLGIFTSLFPEIVQSCYIIGSHVSNDAVATSDVDIRIFLRTFPPEETLKKLEAVCESCEQLCALKVTIRFVCAPYEAFPNWIDSGIHVKLNSLLIYGEDIRSQIPSISAGELGRYYMHITYSRIAHFRPDAQRLRLPLEYPQPADEFRGYLHAENQQYTGTKGIISFMANFAATILCLRAQVCPKSKADVFHLYASLIHDEWTDYLLDAYHKCKFQWEYRIPQDVDERLQVRSICDGLLALEDHYVQLYRTWLEEEVAKAGERPTLVAIGEVSKMLGRDVEELLPAELLHWYDADGHHGLAYIDNFWQMAALYILSNGAAFQVDGSGALFPGFPQ